MSTSASDAASGSGTSATAPSVRVYRAPSSSSPSAAASIAAEEELKPTPEELKAAFKSAILGRNGPDAPLLTRAMREREEQRLGLHASRNRHWEEVKIRIRFSDRTMVEATFREDDTILAVYAFLDSVLDPTVRAKRVVIYTAPPKLEYRRDDAKIKTKTLRELGLIPSAVVCLRWDDPAMNSNSYSAPIKAELSSKAQDLPPPPSFEPASGQTNAPSSAQPGGATKEPKPVPKWLKNIVKK